MMKTQNFQHATNPHVAKKINECIKYADLMHHLHGIAHKDTFILLKRTTHGLTKRILERLIQVDSSKFTDEFMTELLRDIGI